MMEVSVYKIIPLAQAAHWFNYEKLWPQLARILRKEGTVAFWVSPYSLVHFMSRI